MKLSEILTSIVGKKIVTVSTNNQGGHLLQIELGLDDNTVLSVWANTDEDISIELNKIK